jgi:enterochelin esterase-like enzyme
MRFKPVSFAGLIAISSLWGADSFVGDWKLNLSKSEFADNYKATGGRAAYDGIDGGYLYSGDTAFTDGASMLLFCPLKFDGVGADGTLDGHPVRCVAKRLDANAFHVSVVDTLDGTTNYSLRASLDPRGDTLSLLWIGKQRFKLVYDRIAEGNLLEPGRSIEHSFAAGAVDEYRVKLRAGDYCEGVVEQKDGSVIVLAYAPDGSRIRSFGGPPTGQKTFALEAPVAGVYRIVLRSPDKPASSYKISLNKIASLDEWLSPLPAKDKFTSPRIASLRKEVESGRHEAIESFWTEIRKQGTPLIEPLENNDKDMLVTFLWRASGETRNVFIMWFPFAAAKPEDYQMTRLAGTDVWYRTLKVRRGARFAYRLSPNDPLAFDERSFVQRDATAQADPLNPHPWFNGPGSTRFEYSSMVELPGAKPQPYIQKREGVPAGKVEKKHIKSALLKNERDLSVYTPPGYRRDGTPYHLLVVFDESAYLTRVPTPVILDNLLFEKKIPPMVAVLIANPDQDTRTRELPPNPNFADFLNNELMPWIRENYHVTADPRQVVVAGSSFGGIASVYAGLRHPETFGNILCQSGSFWWSAPKPEPYAEPNFLAKEFVKNPKLPLRFYMDAGSFEVDMSGGGGEILEPSRHMRDVLLAKGYEVHYQEFVGGHDYLSWRGTLADGLIALLGIAN